MQLWGCRGAGLLGGDAAVAEASGQGEETRLPSASACLSARFPAPFPSYCPGVVL